MNSKQIEAYKIFNDHEQAINQFSVEKLSKNYIATASFDHLIKVYDLGKQSQVQTLKGHEKGVWTCAYKPDDANTLASGSNDKKLLLWDLKSNKIRDKLTTHNDACRYMMSNSPIAEVY